MSVPRPRHPVARTRVALAAAGLLAGVVGVIAMAESLRPPPLLDVAPELADQEPSDPRIPFECPEPPPLEVDPGNDDVDPAVGLPFDVGSDDLLDCPSFYDGAEVRYRGEAVGAVMRREYGAWLQLNDDLYAEAGPLPWHREFRGSNAGVGVLLPREAVDLITTVGGPRSRGDVVEVIGTFHRIDRATREVAVIRAAEVTVLAEGRPFDAPILVNRLIAALLLTALAAAMVLVQVNVRRRQQRGVAG